MNFVKPSVEIVTEPDLFRRIEIGARNCWRSDDKICEGSDIKMFDNLIKRGHESPLEHSNIVFEVNDVNVHEINHILAEYEVLCNVPHYIRYSFVKEDLHRFSGSARAWRNLCKAVPTQFGKNISSYLPAELVSDLPCGGQMTDDFFPEKVLINPQLDDTHTIVTARFICDRGVSHELVRHRLLGISQESQRYVSYKDGCTFVEPWWWPQQETADTQYVRMACQAAEDAYCNMVKMGCSPQKARCVLPNMLKTEVVATGTIEYWKRYVLPLRLSKAAHPDMRRIMEMFCEKMNWDRKDS